MSANIFESIFVTLVEQDDVPAAAMASGNVAPEMAEPTADGEAADLGSSGIDDEQVLRHAAGREQKMTIKLTEWINKLDEIVEFLNGTNSESMQMQLKKCVPDTLFDKIHNAEAKKIARVAKEISALAETFKGYAATSNSPSLRFVSWAVGMLLPFAAAATSLLA